MQEQFIIYQETIEKDNHSFSSKEYVSFNFMLQSQSAVILELPKMKSLTISIVYPSISHEVMGADVMGIHRPSLQSI